MADGIKLLGLSGSLRAGSLNTALLRVAGSVLPAGAGGLAIASIADFPLYDQDAEAKDLPEPVRRVREQVRAADGLLIATPEYNFSVPGVLKNALDWISRPPSDPVAAGKPVAIMGAGGRLGTARAQGHLRDILRGMDMRAVARPEVFVVRAWEQFDAEQGTLRDPATEQAIRDLLARLVAECEAAAPSVQGRSAR